METLLRIAPCRCEYEIRAGQVVSFRDCAPHGGQHGDLEDLVFDRFELVYDVAAPVVA